MTDNEKAEAWSVLKLALETRHADVAASLVRKARSRAIAADAYLAGPAESRARVLVRLDVAAANQKQELAWLEETLVLVHPADPFRPKDQRPFLVDGEWR